jgi:NADPH-dependent 2,4-dienoyl-CoA reductase/sulfur reductase-like enzyme
MIIVGGGLAAGRAAKTLRDEGFSGDVVLLASERHLPYSRPALSKDYLRGESSRDSLFTMNSDWWDAHNVETHLGSAAVALDTARHKVTLSDGRSFRFSRLLLATGSTARVPRLPGADLAGVHTLRTLEDADALSSGLERARNDGDPIVIIGDGLIGLEAAASARALGLDVTVIGHGPLPLARPLGSRIGEYYTFLHIRNGVRIRRNTSVAEILGTKGRATGVQLSSGHALPAALVLIAIGADPNVGLAAGAGIALAPHDLGGGVLVNDTLQTSHPDVFAAGDIANIPVTALHRTARVDHWATALNTGAHAARAMLGNSTSYDRLPYFYSDQFATSMEFTGLLPCGQAHELIVSGSVQDDRFAAVWRTKGRAQAVLTVNLPDRMDDAEALIRTSASASERALSFAH